MDKPGSPQSNFFLQGKALEQQFSHTVDAAINFGLYIQATLDDIKYNTKTLFWWTSITVLIVIGLFIIGQLVRLRHELVILNRHQDTFKGMWDEDRALELNRLDEQRRNWHNNKSNRAAQHLAELERRRARETDFDRGDDGIGGDSSENLFRRREVTGSPSSEIEDRESIPGPLPSGGGLDELLDAIPPLGSPEYEEFLNSVLRETRRQRGMGDRQRQQSQIYEEEQEEDDDQFYV
ncbi:hypothetical protein F5B20DRAFT_575021 [Whalleya microplaca]|nr:hypothetical protein F5B20DRAFT_575021 [Whalleya microplaca]